MIDLATRRTWTPTPLDPTTAPVGVVVKRHGSRHERSSSAKYFADALEQLVHDDRLTKDPVGAGAQAAGGAWPQTLRGDDDDRKPSLRVAAPTDALYNCMPVHSGHPQIE